ncbi:MAG: energy transducer TonB [SAR86 cluster bacterium]|jgi:colicin import membrane protein|tara:strand:- start:21 stop:632 length:612 start_codon:yes stop_codon:yes gene_type:complete
MQNYLSGFFVSFILHLGLVLSFANFFQIDNLYSLNKVEPMPAYLVFEKPLVISKKKNIKKVKELIQEEPIISPTVLETANAKAEIETVKVEKDLLLKQILGEEIKSSVEEISYYSNLIRDQVIINWKQPSSAKKGMSAEILITLVPTGEIVQVKLIKTSGNQAFDSSTLNAIQKVSKFDGLDMSRRLFDNNFRKFTLVFNPEN